MWWLLIPVVLEGKDYVFERFMRKQLEELFVKLFHADGESVKVGSQEFGDWVFVSRVLPDGRLCVHVRDKELEGARSSEAVREYYYDPASRTLSNSTLRQAFAWKANLKH